MKNDRRGGIKHAVGREGVFFLLAGPSGAGKSCLLRRLLELSPGLVRVVSVTTRRPRPGEVDGRDYRFWTPERFAAAVRGGELLEHAVVHGRDAYGTPRGEVEALLARGALAIKDLDVQGVAQVRRLWPYPRTVSIFVVPPSPEELAARLRGRGTEDEETLARRLAAAREELARIEEYDYLVVNADLEAAAEDLKALCRAEQLKRERRREEFAARWMPGS